MHCSRIRTPQLLLRCWHPTDAQLLQDAVDASLEHLLPWMPWVAGEPESVDRKKRRLCRFGRWFAQGRHLIYGAFDHDETKVLGGFGLHRRVGAGAGEIGYWVHVDHGGRGLGTEGAAALTRIGFEVEGLDRVEIHCDPANGRSAAIPRRLGYDLQATVPGRVTSAAMSPRDTMIWSMRHRRFSTSEAARFAIANLDR